MLTLKLIFFLNKNIRDDYFFYDTFKEIIKKEIYMTTNLKFLMDDMYDKIRENKNGFDEHADDLIKIYYDKITEKEEYNELFEDFVIARCISYLPSGAWSPMSLPFTVIISSACT